MTWSASVERWRPRLRLALFVGIAGYILLGPVPHQVFGARHVKALPRWRMFSGMSMKECAGHFERRDGAAPERFDDWYAILELDPSRGSHRKQARVTGVAAGERLGERLCRKLGPEADVRLFLRCPSRRSGWVSRAKGERNLCVPAPKAQPQGGKKDRKHARKNARKKTERIKRARSELEASDGSSARSTPAVAPQTKRLERAPRGATIPVRERPRPPVGRRSHEEPAP